MAKNIDLRRQAILDLVNKYGTLDFQQLRNAFPGVSDVTLRKDLQYLDDTQQATRTHGGVRSIPSALNYFYRANVNTEKKRAIAAKAVSLIRPGTSIFISAGSTCAELARCLPVFPLKVCSDGICTISNISALPNISVELLGGDVDLNIMRVEGISVLNRLDALHYAVDHAQEGDLIAVIGRGHETYRDRQGVKTPFLERELLEEYAQQIGLE